MHVDDCRKWILLILLAITLLSVAFSECLAAYREYLAVKKEAIQIGEAEKKAAQQKLVQQEEGH